MAAQARWRLLVLACVLAGLFAPALASASTGPYAETRVRGRDLGNPASVSVERAVILGTHWGYALAYDDRASGYLLAARGGGKVTKEVLERATPGRDGGTSRIIREKLDGDTISVTHQVDLDGKIIHQHQTHVGTYGTERQFPDAWVEYPTIPAAPLVP
jgi:hypothetical protein